VANGANGVMVSAGATGNTIGGTLAGQGNTIAANKSNGVALFDPGTSNNAVLGNSIGTDVSGTVIAGNLGDGVLLSSSVSSDRVADNTIANNAVDGVGLNSTNSGNTIQANSIYNNKGSGDQPRIRFKQRAELPRAHWGPSATRTRAMSSAPPRQPAGSLVTIDFYANTAKDPSGYGQGQFYLGSTNVTAGSSFQKLLPVGANPGEWISATATSASGDTSGFAADVVVSQVHTIGNSHQLSQHLDLWPGGSTSPRPSTASPFATGHGPVPGGRCKPSANLSPSLPPPASPQARASPRSMLALIP